MARLPTITERDQVAAADRAAFDSIVTLSRHELDEAKRDQLYRQADSIAFEQAPMVFLYFYNELYSVQPWVKGFVPPVIFNGQRWLDVTLERKTKQ